MLIEDQEWTDLYLFYQSDCVLLLYLVCFCLKTYTCIHGGWERDCTLLYFTLMEFVEKENPCWLQARCLSRYSKLQIISRIYRFVSVFDGLIVNNLNILKLGMENGLM